MAVEILEDMRATNQESLDDAVWLMEKDVPEDKCKALIWGLCAYNYDEYDDFDTVAGRVRRLFMIVRDGGCKIMYSTVTFSVEKIEN